MSAAPLKLVWLVMVASPLVPKVQVGDLALGFEDAFALSAMPLVVAWMFGSQYVRVWKGGVLGLTWGAILASGMVLGIAHSAYLLGHVEVPTEMWQYAKRLVYFAAAIAVFQSGRVPEAWSLGVLMAVFLVLNFIGFLQLAGPFAEPLAAIYSQNEVQFEALVGQGIDTARNYSVTGFSTSWGGLSSFMLAVGLACMLFRPVRGHGDGTGGSILVFAVVAMMSAFNVFLSGSRAALLSSGAVIAGAAILLLLTGRSARERMASAALLVGLGAACFVVIVTFFAGRLDFIQYRNEALVEAYFTGANRFADMETAISALTNAYWWIFGVGNAVQRAEFVEYGVEVEPVYLLVNYGLAGTVLRYLLLWLVLYRGISILRRPELHPGIARPLAAGAVLGVASYGIFSVGYFFFQEAVVGTLPWVLFGAVIGLRRDPLALLRATAGPDRDATPRSSSPVPTSPGARS